MTGRDQNHPVFSLLQHYTKPGGHSFTLSEAKTAKEMVRQSLNFPASVSHCITDQHGDEAVVSTHQAFWHARVEDSSGWSELFPLAAKRDHLILPPPPRRPSWFVSQSIPREAVAYCDISCSKGQAPPYVLRKAEWQATAPERTGNTDTVKAVTAFTVLCTISSPHLSNPTLQESRTPTNSPELFAGSIISAWWADTHFHPEVCSQTHRLPLLCFIPEVSSYSAQWKRTAFPPLESDSPSGRTGGNEIEFQEAGWI